MEIQILNWLQSLHTPILDKIMQLLTHLGDMGIIWIILTIVMLLIPKTRKSDVIMAAGAFVQGSSIELSADGPIKPPYAVYFQGGLTWQHAKLGIMMSLQKLYEKGLVELP